MVARLSSLDKDLAAKYLIELHEDPSTLPEQQAAMTRWIGDRSPRPDLFPTVGAKVCVSAGVLLSN